ncbi:MAG: hypothetical protein GX051_03760 [Clostridiales bacterium]|nr:hypothetical protein [Clostridiales bacterium]
MIKTRTIPYGYTIRNGKTIIEHSEAEIIRSIFEEYIAGASLKEIAEDLTSRKVPYTERTDVWGKARVARIIENAKYVGNSEYDPIIEEDLYRTAGDCKIARNKNQQGRVSAEIGLVRNRIKCGKCGSSMIRTINNQCRIRESWTCTNPACKYTLRISDNSLLEKLTILINRIIKNSKLMLPQSKADNPDNPTVFKLRNEMKSELEKQNPNEQYIIEHIRMIASEQYKSGNAAQNLVAMTAKKRVEMMQLQESFNSTYFTDLAETVFLDDSGQIRLLTKTKTEITEGSMDNGST